MLILAITQQNKKKASTLKEKELEKGHKMSVRVVGRVRPLLKAEREVDVILRTGSQGQSAPSKGDKKSSNENAALAALRDRDTIVRIPNPKNESEEYSFQFNAVYDSNASQQDLFDAEGTCALGDWLLNG